MITKTLTIPNYFETIFRQGKMYRYPLATHEVGALVQFASEGYKKIARAEPVPVPKSPFDDLTQMIADYIAENNWIVALGGFSVMVGFALAFKMRSKEQPKKGKKEKKEKSKTEDKSEKSEKSNSKKSK